MRIAILQTGKTSEKHISAGVELYASRLKKYCTFEIITLHDLKDTKNMPLKEQKLREGKKILEALGKDDFIVLLDERGKELSTSEFAGWLQNRILLPGKRIVFVVGGPWGFSEEVYNAAGFRLSLSRMTFPHQLVRLLFAEQLYRAFTVIKGEPYHHD
ncbi:MAG TPA: 23S rRNA (pseudouridine(1915)-N(3))-methyltransferase RlmH [Bacteroidales bacterium]|nr:23S rRNA (pseudouridine(1915)-N(3))-methyltransferase RlmH [Bacteroidales bacterium]